MKEINGGENIKNEDEKKNEDKRTSKLETIFTEHWNHARHCENERLWFTNIYAAIVAAILVFMGEADFGPILALTLFGLILSVLGFMVVITLSLGYAHHETDIIMIFYYWDKMEFYRHPKKPFFFFNMQRYFYEITIALFAVLFLFYAFQSWTSLAVFPEHLVWPILVFAIAFVIEGLYRLKWNQYFSECWRFDEALREDTERRYRQEWDKLKKDLNFRRKIIKDAKKRKKK